MVAQGEQVVSQVHAVVVLDGCQVRELEQVLPGQRRRASLNFKNLTGGGWAGVDLDLIKAAWCKNGLTCGTLGRRHRRAGTCSSL